MVYHGFVNLLKPPGVTSHDAVSQLRRLFGTKAVGHAGTLDPAASGVLPLAVGKATRLLEYLVAQEKTYIGEVTFGIGTDTMDQEGKIIWRADSAPVIDLQVLESVLREMVGNRKQIPPAYSAIKHQGRPLYDYARAGEAVTVPARQIVIHSLSLLSFDMNPWPRLLFRVRCSKGTYIRSLVQEIAEQLGTQGTLTFLLRERVGDFAVQDAFTLEEISDLGQAGSIADCLLSPSIALQGWPSLELDLGTAKRFLQGQCIRLEPQQLEGQTAVYHAEHLLGVGQVQQGNLAPRKVLANWEELSGHDYHTTF